MPKLPRRRLPRDETLPLAKRPGWLVFGTAPLTAALAGFVFNGFYNSWLIWGIFWILAAAFAFQTYLILLRFDHLEPGSAAGYGLGHIILPPVAICVGGATLALLDSRGYMTPGPIYILPAMVALVLDAVVVGAVLTQHKRAPRRAPLPRRTPLDPSTDFDIPEGWDEAATPPDPPANRS